MTAAANWQTYNGAAWVAAASAPTGITAQNNNVNIRAPNTCTFDAAAAVTWGSLTVNGAAAGAGGTLSFNNGGVRTLTVSGNVTINSGTAANGSIVVAGTATPRTHSFTIGGNLTNNGTFTMVSGGRVANVTFNQNGNQTVSGTGTTTFNQITLNMGASKANMLDVQSVITMAVAAGTQTLMLTNGTFRLSSASTITPFGGSVTIAGTAGYSLNSASAVSNWGTAGSLTVNGDLTVTNGTMTVGGTNNSIAVGATGSLSLSGGQINVARLQANTLGGAVTIAGGTFSIPSGGTVNTAVNAIFEMTGATFSMTNGTVSIASPNGNTTHPDLEISQSGTPVTGGTFLITTGNTGTAKAITVSSNVPVYNLTVQEGTDALTAQLKSNLTVNNAFTLTSGTLDIAGNTLTLDGSVSGGGTLTCLAASTVNYNQSTTGQNVLVSAYGNLTFSNSNKVLPAGVVGIASVFTPGSATGHTITGNTIDFNGTGAQDVPAFSYNNLTFSGARTTNSVTLASSGTIGVAGVFSPSATFTSGGYSITGSTVDFNGTLAQTIPAFNYYNLTISGDRTISGVTLDPVGVIGIAGIFNPSATFTSGGYTVTGSTVDFNGLAQIIPSFNGATGYNNLSLSGASVTKTAGGTINVNGNFDNGGAADDAVTFVVDVNTLVIAGTRDNTSSLVQFAGALNGLVFSTGTVEYNGIVAQTVSPGTYNSLVFTNSGVKSIYAATTATGDVTVNSGAPLSIDISVTVQVNGNFTNNGSVTNSGNVKVGP